MISDHVTEGDEVRQTRKQDKLESTIQRNLRLVREVVLSRMRESSKMSLK